MDMPEQDYTAITPGHQAPVIRLTLSRSIAQDYVFAMESYVARDAPPTELHGLMDKMATSVSRQFAKVALRDTRLKLKHHEAAHTRAQEDIERMDERFNARAAAAVSTGGRRKTPEMMPNEKADRLNALKTVDRWAEEIREMHTYIDYLKELAGE